MLKKAKMGEIWLVAMPILLVKGKNNYDTAFQIRLFLIVDEGKGMLVIENSDYLALKVTTKRNNVSNIQEIENWQELGLKQKSYIRIEIPQRIEENQLIGKITKVPKEQFYKYYKSMLELFNISLANKMLEKEAI